MKMIMNKVGQYLALFFVIHLLSGCTGLSNLKLPFTKDTTQGKVTVKINANQNSNPNDQKEALPVKICLMVTDNQEQIIDGLYEGAPCKKNENNKNYAYFMQDILLPSSEKNIQFTVNFDNPKWLIVAAEFKEINGSTSFIKEKIDIKKRSFFNIGIDGNTVFNRNKLLSAVENSQLTNPDQLKDKVGGANIEMPNKSNIPITSTIRTPMPTRP